jgi:pimeloyl-ACP methyl ester carboxylesterase
MDQQLYRSAEEALWDELGVTRTERHVHLSRNDVDVRLQEIGEGSPVVFLHGGPGSAGSGWAALAARLPEFHCLLVDRPGTGLSEAQLLADTAAVLRQSETLLVDVLDAVGLGQAHVVGSSHGSHIALLSAAAHPERVGRSFHFGCPGFAENMTLTSVDRLVLFPGMARLFAALPVSERGLLKTLRQLGHGATLDSGGPSPATLGWFLALQQHTDTMRHEFQAMTAMGSFRHGFDPALTIRSETLELVKSPTYFLWGEHDIYGDERVARAMVEAMPEAELEMLPRAGHLCWLDDLDRAAAALRGHLLG